MMADFSKFRSALGGFNREDVANFIESQSIAHQKELRALREENAKLTAERDEAQQALAALQEQAAAAAEADAEEAPQETVPQQPLDLPADELEAYRRAEAAERNARERAAKLREQVSALCADAGARFALRSEKVGVLADQTEEQLRQLMQALSELREGIDLTQTEFAKVEPEQ